MKNKFLFGSVFLSLALVGCNDEVVKDKEEEINTNSAIVVDESNEDNVKEQVLLIEDNDDDKKSKKLKESEAFKGLTEGVPGDYVKVKEFLSFLKEVNKERKLSDVKITNSYSFNDSNITLYGDYNSKGQIYNIEGLVYNGKFKDEDTKGENKAFGNSTFNYKDKTLQVTSFFEENYEPFKSELSYNLNDIMIFEEMDILEVFHNNINLSISSYEDYNVFIDVLDKLADEYNKSSENYIGINYHEDGYNIKDSKFDYIYSVDISNLEGDDSLYTLRFDEDLNLISVSYIYKEKGKSVSLLSKYRY